MAWIVLERHIPTSSLAFGPIDELLLEEELDELPADEFGLFPLEKPDEFEMQSFLALFPFSSFTGNLLRICKLKIHILNNSFSHFLKCSNADSPIIPHFLAFLRIKCQLAKLKLFIIPMANQLVFVTIQFPAVD